jgi:hypothetical protein
MNAFGVIAMSIEQSNQTELAEIIQIAQEGEQEIREMSDRVTIIAEKWRVKTHAPEQTPVKTESKITLA